MEAEEVSGVCIWSHAVLIDTFSPRNRQMRGAKEVICKWDLPLFLDNNGALSTAKGVIFILQLLDPPSVAAFANSLTSCLVENHTFI